MSWKCFSTYNTMFGGMGIHQKLRYQGKRWFWRKNPDDNPGKHQIGRRWATKKHPESSRPAVTAPSLGNSVPSMAPLGTAEGVRWISLAISGGTGISKKSSFRLSTTILSEAYAEFWMVGGWWLPLYSTTIWSTVTPGIGEHQDPEPDSWWCITGLMLQAKLSHHHICLLVGRNRLKPWMKPTPSAVWIA